MKPLISSLSSSGKRTSTRNLSSKFSASSGASTGIKGLNLPPANECVNRRARRNCSRFPLSKHHPMRIGRYFTLNDSVLISRCSLRDYVHPTRTAERFSHVRAVTILLDVQRLPQHPRMRPDDLSQALVVSEHFGQDLAL